MAHLILPTTTLIAAHFFFFFFFFVGLLHAQLQPSDFQALKLVRSKLDDMPGSTFFPSWNFANDDPCSFSGVLCDIVDGVERVVALNLGEPRSDSPGLRGHLSPALGSLSALVQLTLAPGKITGPIPDSLGSLTNLQNVGLSKNLLSGSIPPNLASLQQLVTLDLSYNRLAATIPQALGTLPSLIALILCHNRLTGTIPPLRAPLDHLDLKQNMLDGTLPSLPNSLSYLSLSNNQLSGSLDNIAGLHNLAYLDLSFNQFSGSIPSSTFGFPLTSLLLQRNLLSGSLAPTQLVVIPKVDLSYNKLTGQISPFFAFVQNLYLNNNQFTGVVPQEFIDQLLSSSIQTLFLQHNFLTEFELNPSSALPVTAALCIQYNCMHPPINSPCPHNAGREQSRPSYQCKSN